ncbi:MULTISPECIES: class III lanthipeptide [Priestia]|nr:MULTISPECIES: class III lanthipeptide [Priestia]MCP1452374.1 hypothetical protein [Priestia megaterium]MDC7767139.1 class III lanthipeptide [Priestia aryabhattai]UPK52830.1 class III lanthipeptide [Bacillus sp. H8-1]WKG33420.1 class III lanthipeptide [Priestia aryabhattai]
MSKTDVLSLQGLKEYKNTSEPIGSNISVNCKQKSSLSIFACIRPK